MALTKKKQKEIQTRIHGAKDVDAVKKEEIAMAKLRNLLHLIAWMPGAVCAGVILQVLSPILFPVVTNIKANKHGEKFDGKKCAKDTLKHTLIGSPIYIARMLEGIRKKDATSIEEIKQLVYLEKHNVLDLIDFIKNAKKIVQKEQNKNILDETRKITVYHIDNDSNLSIEKGCGLQELIYGTFRGKFIKFPYTQQIEGLLRACLDKRMQELKAQQEQANRDKYKQIFKDMQDRRGEIAQESQDVKTK